MRLIFTFILAIILSGCSASTTEAPKNIPVTHFGTKVHDSGQAVVVRYGDTLYDIAKRHQIPLRSLIDLNDIGPSFEIKTGQVLRVPNPDVHIVARGDNIRNIALVFGVDQSEIVRLNRLQAPYKLTMGQRLQLPALQYEASVSRRPTAKHPQTRDQRTIRTTPATKPTGRIHTQDLPPLPDAKPGQPTQVARYKPSRTRIKKRKKPKTYGAPGTPSFGWPLQGRVISGFGPKSSGRFNDGINIAARKGTPIRSAAAGEVVYIGNELEGFGNLMLVRHNNGWMTAYAHLDRALVSKGTVVKKGQTLATVGRTGSVSSPQLHFEIRKGSKPINPKTYLP